MQYFSLILVLATLLTGLVWLVDALWLGRKRKQAAAGRQAGGPKEPVWVEYSKSFFPVLFIVLILRSFIAEPFKIPSGSMLPTLKVGDFILVNKFAYGLRLPVIRTKVVSIGEPGRGDVVVFKYPEDPSKDFIKRVVGLPGDRIAYRDKQVFINGEPAETRFLQPYLEQKSRTRMGYLQSYEEQLGDITHRILRDPYLISPDEEYTVPPGHYFVMGDNRDDSRDSRVWGVLPEENLVGKAFFIWMHWDIGGDGLDLSRIGDSIR